MEKDRQILGFIKKARKRLCRNIRVKIMLWALCIGILLWGILNTVALFVPFYGAMIYGFSAFVLSLLCGYIFARSKYPNLRRTSLTIDAKGLKERVTTSYELAGKTDFFSELQKSDTLARIRKIQVNKLFPLKLNKRIFFGPFRP